MKNTVNAQRYEILCLIMLIKSSKIQEMHQMSRILTDMATLPIYAYANRYTNFLLLVLLFIIKSRNQTQWLWFPIVSASSQTHQADKFNGKRAASVYEINCVGLLATKKCVCEITEKIKQSCKSTHTYILCNFYVLHMYVRMNVSTYVSALLMF